MFRFEPRFALPLVIAWTLYAQPSPIIRTAADAAQAETQLVSDPANSTLRAQLMRYYSRPSTTGVEHLRELRSGHIVWMIEHDPENAVLGEGAGTLDKTGHPLADPHAFEVADREWQKVLREPTPSARKLANAAQFYRVADPSQARQLANEGLASFPADARLGFLAGNLDALLVLGATALDSSGTAYSFTDRLRETEEVARARRELEESNNISRLSTAASTLTQLVPALGARSRPAQVVAALDLAARCYERAMTFEPDNARWKTNLRTVFRTAANLQTKPTARNVYLERAARVPGTDMEQFNLLPELALSRFEVNDYEGAESAAKDCLRMAAEDHPGWVTGDAVHYGNIVLGRIALEHGEKDEAKSRLLAAGHATGSPRLNSVGPDWKLAQDLLAKGERDTVLAYIELCRAFWRRDGGRLDAYTTAIRSGTTPNLLAPVTAGR